MSHEDWSREKLEEEFKLCQEVSLKYKEENALLDDIQEILNGFNEFQSHTKREYKRALKEIQNVLDKRDWGET